MVCSPGPGVTVTLLPSMLSEAQKPEVACQQGKGTEETKASNSCPHGPNRALSYPTRAGATPSSLRRAGWSAVPTRGGFLTLPQGTGRQLPRSGLRSRGVSTKLFLRQRASLATGLSILDLYTAC